MRFNPSLFGGFLSYFSSHPSFLWRHMAEFLRHFHTWGICGSASIGSLIICGNMTRPMSCPNSPRSKWWWWCSPLAWWLVPSLAWSMAWLTCPFFLTGGFLSAVLGLLTLSFGSTWLLAGSLINYRYIYLIVYIY